MRSTPYSRRFPQFGRERLAQSLVGGRHRSTRYEGAALRRQAEGRAAGYDELAARPDFKDALDRLIAGSADATLCLMCAEKEPLDCHRTVLVSRRLAERGAAIEHLLADGKRKPHAVLEEELLEASDDGAPDLFTTAEDRSQRLARAYQKRERVMKRA